MRVWVDITNSPHVPVFAPLISRLRARGDTVEITAREYAQTLQLLELHELEAEVIGRHGGRSRLGKARSLVSRERALRAWAKGRGFDLALAHGSYDLTLHRPPARDPERDHVRLRVGLAPAPARLPRRDEGRRPGGDPARAAEALRRGAAEAAPLPGAEGGVLPRRLRARPRGAREASAWTRRASSSSCARRPTSRSTTGTRTRSSRRRSTGSAATRQCMRSCSRAPTISASTSARSPSRRCCCRSAPSTRRA